MEFMEAFRRFKRLLDSNKNVRRGFILVIIIFVMLWLFGLRTIPSPQSRTPLDPVESCMHRNLAKYQDETNDLDTNIMHIPALHSDEHYYMPYVGNGYIGLALKEPDATIHIKPYRGRILDLQIPFRPIVQVSVMDEESRSEFIASQYLHGLVNRVACIDRQQGDAIEIASVFHAHRVFPTMLEQNISITNPSSRPAVVQFDQRGWSSEPPFKTEQKTMQLPEGDVPYVLGIGIVETSTQIPMAVVIAYKKVPNHIQVSGLGHITLRIVTVVNYMHLSNKKDLSNVQGGLIEKTESELKIVLQQDGSNLYRLHKTAWKDLWNTGFHISTSRAENALNGDKINATMYYVLSQVRAPLHEIGVPASQIVEANSVLAYAEGCYGGHHTLQAPSLWTSLSTEKDLLGVCNVWLLTLEKLGCHKLLRAGASGVIQGMVLSFGGLKFRNDHLEFNTEPKDLHRDFHFRRIWYGNSTHVNISVVVGIDNKAVLFAALDRKDKDYYACDGGCLDDPTELGPQPKQFPVKLTEPVTSILYITSDRKHAEELHFSIHVREIVEAPPHEHHVISMHRHGSGYSAMSTMFWVFLSLLIIIFHLFLFHLVYTEYFGSSQERYRSRKVSDF